MGRQLAPEDLEGVATAELLSELKRRHNLLSRPGARVAVLGPPCAGKRTQAEALRRAFGICRVSGSDLLGGSAEGGGSPDERAVSMLTGLLDQPQCRRGFVLEGFPTTVSQAQRLQEALERQGKAPLERAIFLDAPEESLLDRCRGRMVHLPSGRLYHERLKSPIDEGLDDFTSEALVGIPHDDTKFQTCLKKYQEDSKLLREFFTRAGVASEVQATGKADVVAAACSDALKSS